MKTKELEILKNAVKRSVNLSQGVKIELGLMDEKEQKHLAKAFKPFVNDLLVKAAVKGKTFAQWAGCIELLGGEQLSVLQVDRFGKRTAYLLPRGGDGELTALPESAFSLEQVQDLLHMANRCSADARDKLLCKAETVADPAERGEADRQFLDKALDMLARLRRNCRKSCGNRWIPRR